MNQTPKFKLIYQLPAWSRICLLIAALLVGAIYLFWRHYLMLRLAYDIDELSYLHTAWLYSTGTEFLKNNYNFVNSPLLGYALVPLIRLIGDSSLVYYRIAMSVLSYVTLGLFFLLNYHCTKSKGSAALATFVLAISSPFLIKMFEIRCEPFAILAFVAGFYFFYLASANKWAGRWCLIAGIFLGLSVAFKMVNFPYLLAFWFVFLLHIKKSITEGSIWRSIVFLAIGTLIPFVSMLWNYFPFFSFMSNQPVGLLNGVSLIIVTIGEGLPTNIAVGNDILNQPVFWSIGAFAAILAIYRLRYQPSIVVEVHLMATILYFSIMPWLKKGLFLQDLVFPAISVALFIGHISILPVFRRRAVWLVPLLLVGLLIDGWFFGIHTVKHSDEERFKYKETIKDLEISTISMPAEAVSLLSPFLGRTVYATHVKRTEQDAAIQFFNEQVSDEQTSIAANCMNVFRPNAPSWSSPLAIMSDAGGLEYMVHVVQKLPWLGLFLSCKTPLGPMIDSRTSGMGENLVRDLERSHPQVVLVDRFMLDLWQKYPAYLKLYNDNYMVQYDQDSKMFFAIRRDAPWVGAGLPPMPPISCD